MSKLPSLVSAHQANGRYVDLGGVNTFVAEMGKGEPVLCIHGVPSSSFLYRKVLSELSKKGFRALALDLPGLGLSQRPKEFDYSWTGLGKWLSEATEALGLKRFHLVVHDIGGPVGFELVANHPERIASLTILNTLLVGVGSFQKPWVMRPFEVRGLGELYVATLIPPALRILMYLQGVENRTAFGLAEAQAYVHLLKREDRGRAFLKIMRHFEPTPAKEDLYRNAVAQLEVPKQVIWGEFDPALTPEAYGYPIRDQLGIDRFHLLPGKHFLQEDQAPALARLIAEMLATPTAK